MVSACAPGPADTASHKPAGVRAQLHEQSYWAHYVEAVQYFHPVLCMLLLVFEELFCGLLAVRHCFALLKGQTTQDSTYKFLKHTTFVFWMSMLCSTLGLILWLCYQINASLFALAAAVSIPLVIVFFAASQPTPSAVDRTPEQRRCVPLIVEPLDGDLLDAPVGTSPVKSKLGCFVRDNREWIVDQLKCHGAVLLRGFCTEEIGQEAAAAEREGDRVYNAFDEAIEQLQLRNIVYSSSPREQVSRLFQCERRPTLRGTSPGQTKAESKVLSGVMHYINTLIGPVVWAGTNFVDPLPDNRFLFHNEGSYSMHDGYPEVIAFACRKAPQVKGATLLSNCTLALQGLQDQRSTLLDHEQLVRVMSTDLATFQSGKHNISGHVASEGLEKWKKEVAEFHGMGFKMIGQEHVHIERYYKPLIQTSKSGVHCLMGHLEEWFVAKMSQTFHYGVLNSFVYGLSSGRIISWTELYELFRAYWLNTSFVPWKAGDLLLLDNSLVAHTGSNGIGKRTIAFCPLRYD